MLCSVCSGDAANLARLIPVCRFEGVAREAVHALKYQDRHAIAKTLGALMATCVGAGEFDRVTHVPLHKRRLQERGYDQSALLARTVAAQLGIPCDPSLLVRTRYTQQQAKLQHDERRSNVEGAFKAQMSLNGERFLLVDDVTTTRSTLGAAATALREAGAGDVTGVVFGMVL